MFLRVFVSGASEDPELPSLVFCLLHFSTKCTLVSEEQTVSQCFIRREEVNHEDDCKTSLHASETTDDGHDVFVSFRSCCPLVCVRKDVLYIGDQTGQIRFELGRRSSAARFGRFMCTNQQEVRQKL